jgi:hypothetical protein
MNIDLTDEAAQALVDDISLDLSQAEKHHQAGSHRKAFQWVVRAASDALRGMRAPQAQIDVVQHLYDALEDLDRGSVDASLAPAEIANRPGEPTAAWIARACLAATLEIRMARGERAGDAALAIVRASALARKLKLSRTDAAGRLVEWRRNFRKKRTPAGQDSFDGFVEVIARRKAGLLKDRFDTWSINVEAKLLRMAAEYWGRLRTGPGR